MPSPVAAKNPTKLERMVPVKRIKREKEEDIKIDIVDIVKHHRPSTGIIERIKKNDPDNVWYVLVTKEIALDLLCLNDYDQNRDIDWGLVKSYIEQMKAKVWKQRNGDTFSISKKLKLLNGQQRLLAIYISGIPCEYPIVTGLDEDAFSYMDLQRRRNAQDITAINGFKANSAQLAQIVKYIIMYETKSTLRATITDKHVPNWQVNSFERRASVMADLAKDLEYAKRNWMKQTANFLSASQWVFVFYILRMLPGMALRAKEFMDQFASGVELKPNSPIRIVRQYFEKDFSHLKNRSHNRSNMVSITTKIKHIFEAWNLNLRNEKVGEIKVDMHDPIIPKPIWRQ